MSQKKDTGLTIKPWPILLDHYKDLNELGRDIGSALYDALN